MRLPYMRYSPAKSQDMRTGFGGLNLREDAAEGEFSEMENLSSDKSPYVSPRRPRRTLAKSMYPVGDCVGLYGCNDFLLYASKDGTIYRVEDENFRNIMAPGKKFSSDPKQFIRMGAYIVIWPDKILYNTETKTTESLENTFTSFGTVTLHQSNLAGEDSETGTYMRLEASGIGAGFSQYDGIEIEGLTGDAASFNSSHIIYTVSDDFIVIAGIVSTTHSQSDLITVSRKCPDMDYIVESQNRLWGCSSKNHELYACKLGDPRNWNCYLGIASDSYAVTIGSEGDFTGAAAVSDVVVFFKEGVIHKILGNKPANYQVVDTPGRGVMRGCASSLAVVDEILYYVSREGVMAYDGALPYSVGESVARLSLREAYGASWQGKYILSALNTAESAVLLAYDTRKNLWHREDSSRMLYFAYALGRMYCAGGDHGLTCLSDGTAKDESVSWRAVTGRIMLETPGHKYVSKLILHIGCPTSAPLKTHPPRVSIRYDSGTWEPCKVHAPSGRGLVYLASIPLRRASFANIKIEGKGDFVLYGMSKTLERGSELGRSSAR